MVSEFGIPFVYDDYEYWPIYFKRQSEISKDKILEHPVQQENSYENFQYLRPSIHLTERDLDWKD